MPLAVYQLNADTGTAAPSWPYAAQELTAARDVGCTEHWSRIMRDEGGRKVETAVEARAGFLDRPVLLVLCVSLVLGVVILGALWLGFFGSGS